MRKYIFTALVIFYSGCSVYKTRSIASAKECIITSTNESSEVTYLIKLNSKIPSLYTVQRNDTLEEIKLFPKGFLSGGYEYESQNIDEEIKLNILNGVDVVKVSIFEKGIKTPITETCKI